MEEEEREEERRARSLMFTVIGLDFVAFVNGMVCFAFVFFFFASILLESIVKAGKEVDDGRIDGFDFFNGLLESLEEEDAFAQKEANKSA